MCLFGYCTCICKYIHMYICLNVRIYAVVIVAACPLPLALFSHSRIPIMDCFRQRTQFPVHSHFPFPVLTGALTYASLPLSFCLSVFRLNSCSASIVVGWLILAFMPLLLFGCVWVFHTACIGVQRIKSRSRLLFLYLWVAVAVAARFRRRRCRRWAHLFVRVCVCACVLFGNSVSSSRSRG